MWLAPEAADFIDPASCPARQNTNDLAAKSQPESQPAKMKKAPPASRQGLEIKAVCRLIAITSA
jgi:hypothetical protein